MTAPFHAGELAAQARAGVPTPRGAGIRDAMADQHRDFFAGLRCLFIATLDDAGWPMPTLLTGPPGFVDSPDDRTLRLAATPVAPDPTARWLRPGAPVGLLGIDLASRRRNRANGRLAAADAALTVAVEQSFGNCAKYITSRAVEPTRPRQAALERFDTPDAPARTLIAAADTCFVASHAGAVGGVDLSHRGGPPGFAEIDGNRLTLPDYAGNRYFNTFGNLMLEPRAALLFVDFTHGDVLVLQGDAEIEWTDARRWHLDVVRGWRLRGAVPLRWRAPES